MNQGKKYVNSVIEDLNTKTIYFTQIQNYAIKDKDLVKKITCKNEEFRSFINKGYKILINVISIESKLDEIYIIDNCK